MHFHDFHLSSFQVSEDGTTAILAVRVDADEGVSACLRLAFEDVAAYYLDHPGEAPVLGIEEAQISDVLSKFHDKLHATVHKLKPSPPSWEAQADYCRALEEEGYKAFTIHSTTEAVGFVFAQAVIPSLSS